MEDSSSVSERGLESTNHRPAHNALPAKLRISQYCSDGVTWKTQTTCENGDWVPQNNPKPCPQCWPENKIEILENCPDGATWRTRQVCQNGAWTREANTKPCPQCWPEGKEVESDEKCLVGRSTEPIWLR